MEKRSVEEVLWKTCIMDLYRVPKDAKIWRVYHVYGDYEMPLNLFIDSNNMIIGTNDRLNRFYVGKVGEKYRRADEEVAPITLYFMDHHKGKDYLGHDACHQEGLQNYYGHVYFICDNAYLWGAHGEVMAGHNLPASDGTLFEEIESLRDCYLEASLPAFVYSAFGQSCEVSPEVLPLVQTIEKLTAQSSAVCYEDDLNIACDENGKSYDLKGHVFYKKRGEARTVVVEE